MPETGFTCNNYYSSGTQANYRQQRANGKGALVRRKGLGKVRFAEVSLVMITNEACLHSMSSLTGTRGERKRERIARRRGKEGRKNTLNV